MAFSKTHTAHKLVIPLEMRGRHTRPRTPIVSIPPSAPALHRPGATKAKPKGKPASAKTRPKKTTKARGKPKEKGRHK